MRVNGLLYVNIRSLRRKFIVTWFEQEFVFEVSFYYKLLFFSVIEKRKTSSKNRRKQVIGWYTAWIKRVTQRDSDEYKIFWIVFHSDFVWTFIEHHYSVPPAILFLAHIDRWNLGINDLATSILGKIAPNQCHVCRDDSTCYNLVV